MAELSENYNVYTLDLPGYGKSDKPRHILNISELSDALAGWMEMIGIGRAVLVGHSFGCQITADFALRHSDKIERAVLAAPTVDKNRRTALHLFTRSLLNAPQEPLSLIWIAIKSFFQFGLIRQVKTLRFALEDRLEDKLPHINIPALVLRGSQDTVVPQDWTQSVADLLPRSKLVTVPGGTHGFNYSFPELFAKAIKEFLDTE
jgi:pimeloyl-ACP methyl ester carboxylesterase